MTTSNPTRDVRALALFATLQATFSDVHPFCDQIIQAGTDAIDKGKPGAAGRRACARHVGSYSAGQLAAAAAVTRALGYRVPPAALLTGTAINAITHYVIDRRTPLTAFLGSAWARRLRLVGNGKLDYLRHATVQRRDGVVDTSGPGTALMECDQALHRILGVLASAVITVLATRADGAR
ncbi:hypothetical protein L3Q67_45230 (plasmid) [Saccharothrix sp. AJ9571]|nr:hypothetical protein L3Q67_45230 [Saccharothrix sp. AJ9571]